MSDKKTATDRFNDDFIAEVIDAVRASNAPWQKKWASAEIASPYNATNDRLYSGRNAIRLAMKAAKHGYTDPRWATARQIKDMGGLINKGEKGTGVLFFGQRVVTDEKGEEKTVPSVKHYHVFNLHQTNLPTLSRAEIRATEPDLEAFAAILAHHKPKIVLGEPAYMPRTDTVYLPDKASFLNDAVYYSTALHEMGHWTGHESRLDRQLNNRFGTPAYAREELVAELSSYMLALEYGLPFEPNDHESYLKHWAERSDQELEDALRQAFTEATHAKHYLDAPLREKRLEKSVADREPDTRDPQKKGEERRAVAQMDSAERHPRDAEVAGLVGQTESRASRSARETDPQEQPAFSDLFYREIDEQGRIDAILGQKRTYLSVGWDERREAKTLGAKWDSAHKLWVAEHGLDNQPELKKFVRRASDHLGASTGGKTLEDLRVAAEAIGLDMSRFDDTPGKWHRVPLHGRSPRDKDGAYKIFDNIDGTLGAVVKNLSSGETLNWSNRGAEHSQVPNHILKAEEMNRPTRMAVQEAVHAETQAERAWEMLAAYKTLEDANGKEPYVTRKGMRNIHGLRRLEDGSIVVPMINGERFGQLSDVSKSEYLGVVNLQIISPDGTKRFGKQCQKLGAYFPIGKPPERVAPAYVIIAEGVASAEAAYQLFAHPTNRRVLAIAAFDTGNLLPVAETIRKVYPDAQKILAVDNDLATARKIGKNPGVVAATNVAAHYPEFRLVIPEGINGQNTDWNDALLADRNKALVHFADQVAGRVSPDKSQSSPVRENEAVPEAETTPGKPEANPQPLLSDIKGLCPRDIGKKCFEATGGDLAKLPQIKSELAKQGFQFDERRLEGVGNHPAALKDAYGKAVSAIRRRGIKEAMYGEITHG